MVVNAIGAAKELFLLPIERPSRLAYFALSSRGDRQFRLPTNVVNRLRESLTRQFRRQAGLAANFPQMN